MDTSQNLLQEETLVIINFYPLYFYIFTKFLVLANSFDPTVTIPYLFKQCSTDVHYGPFRLRHQASGGIQPQPLYRESQLPWLVEPHERKEEISHYFGSSLIRTG